MLSEIELAALFRDLELPPEARILIEEIRSTAPSRRVRGGAGNVVVRYPSRKMGFVIQAESHKVELAGIYEYEYDEEVLEYYDQPPPIKLSYEARNGKRVGVIHTPDFFMIRSDGIGWEEWKTEDELEKLLLRMPHRYERGEDGRWRCPPGENVAGPLELYYRIRSSAEIDWVLQRKLRFLEDYFRSEGACASPELVEKVRSRLEVSPGLSLGQLLEWRSEVTSDNLYAMIAAGDIFVDLRAAPLVAPDKVRVFSHAAMAEACRVVRETTDKRLVPARGFRARSGLAIAWDGRLWIILNVGNTTTTLLAEDGTSLDVPNETFITLISQGKIAPTDEEVGEGLAAEANELLARASPSDLAEANRRYAILAPRLQGHRGDETGRGKRTNQYRWLRQWRWAEQAYGCGYLGLLPQYRQRGNRLPKLPERSRELLRQAIKEQYETPRQMKKMEVYALYRRKCEEEGLKPASYVTFHLESKGRPRHEQVAKRAGERVAYTSEPFYWELERTTPRHGDRPFEIGHVDHTELDIELICSEAGRNLGRPWASFLVDAFSRRFLAIYLTFDAPSYRSCMMVLRACVRRHGRLPQILVVDGGPEFESVYFETLLARFEVTKKTRPAAKPRFGSVIERLFGTTNTRFVHNLVGNTQATRNIRQMTKAVDPKRHAVWSLPRLYERLCEWAYEVYDDIEHAALGMTPREAFARGIARGGRRPQQLIPHDARFEIWSLPSTPKGVARVMAGQGVRINYLNYWSDWFRDPRVEGTPVPVRYDPWNAGIAYAYVRGAWVRCISDYYPDLVGRSEKEIMHAAAELRRRRKEQGRRYLNVTTRQIADFLRSLEAEEVLVEQRLRSNEGKKVLALIEGNFEEESRSSSDMDTAIERPSSSAEVAAADPWKTDIDDLEIYPDLKL